jgi:AcrR family transcriptional regulator
VVGDQGRDGDERQALIGAAWAVLGRSGFEGLKVQLVAREAGVSARTFYRHFADKDALLVALVQDEMARAGLRLRAAVARADGAVAQVAAWVAGVMGAAADPKRVARARLFTVQQMVMREHADEVAAGTALLIEPLAEALEIGRREGMFPWADVERDAALIYGLTGNQLSRALVAPPTRTVDELIAETTSFALRALGLPQS